MADAGDPGRTDPPPDSVGGEAEAQEGRERLEGLRDRIEAVDEELIRLMGERRELVLEIGRIKRGLGLPVLDPRREARVVRRAAERSRELGVDEEMTRDVLWRIIASAREAQEGERGWGPPRDPSGPPGREGA